MTIYSRIAKNKKHGKKQFAVLVDPDKTDGHGASLLAKIAEEAAVDFLFVGGSLLTNNQLAECIAGLKESCAIPVVLFPGSTLQINAHADALLFLSLISGRNAEMLIGKHVVSAPLLKASRLEVISTGYMLIDGGRPTAVSYMSGTTPIPSDKDDIAACTALAGEMLGMKLIYMDAGSGAAHTVAPSMIGAVCAAVNIPLVVGGGIKTAAMAKAVAQAGADVVVVGNSIEKDFSAIRKIARAVKSLS